MWSTKKTLRKQSEEIISIFTKTIENLSSINKEGEVEIQTNNLEIQRLEQNNTELMSVIKSNSNIINNVNKLFNN